MFSTNHSNRRENLKNAFFLNFFRNEWTIRSRFETFVCNYNLISNTIDKRLSTKVSSNLKSHCEIVFFSTILRQSDRLSQFCSFQSRSFRTRRLKQIFFFDQTFQKQLDIFRRNNDSKLRVLIVLSLTNSKIFDNFVAQISLVDSKVSRNIINSTKQTSTKQTFFEFNSFNTREIFVEKNIYDLSFDSKFSFSINANFDSIVQTIIIVVVTTIVIQIVAQFQSQQNQNEKNQNENFQSTIRFSKNIDYFYLKYIDVNDFSNIFFIVIIDRYIWYRDVYAFTNKLKNLVKRFIDESRIKKLLLDCLKKETFIWKNEKCNNVFKNALRVVNLKIWYSFLINRFKKRVSIVLQIMQTKKYIMTNARNDKFSRDYVQNILRHVKVVDFFFFSIKWLSFEAIWTLNFELKYQNLRLLLSWVSFWIN